MLNVLFEFEAHGNRPELTSRRWRSCHSRVGQSSLALGPSVVIFCAMTIIV